MHEIKITGVCFAFPAMRIELWSAAGVWIPQGDPEGRTGTWGRECSGQSDRDAPSGMLPLTRDGASCVFWGL